LPRRVFPGGRIAAITSTILSPSFFAFIFAPLLDVRLSRRTYALIFIGVAASSVAITVMHRSQLRVVETVSLAGYLAATLVQGAVGGWMGSLIPKEEDSHLGAWFTVANIGTGGVMMLAAGWLVSRARPAIAGSLLGLMLLAPVLIYPFVPAPGPDRKLARESYAHFFTEVFALLKRRRVQVGLLLFLLPSASFALTNVFGGIGADYRASEHLVGLLAGVGSSLAGVAGSLLLPPLVRRLELRPLYLAIGLSGALFTLSLLLLPRVPWAFAVAISGENLFQALALAASTAITFEIIGPRNPLAATLFSLLIAASNFSIVYMGFVDGRAYTWRGVSGSLLVDALVSMGACLTLGLLWFALGRRSAMPLGPHGLE
jgi:PAT family beta-lactamase induction signal transducer AmpG